MITGIGEVLKLALIRLGAVTSESPSSAFLFVPRDASPPESRFIGSDILYFNISDSNPGDEMFEIRLLEYDFYDLKVCRNKVVTEDIKSLT